MSFMQQHTDMIYVTQQGYQKLQQQLSAKQQEYAQVREHRQVAFELSGDGWHDNPEFNRMQQLEASVNHAVKTLTERLQNTRIIDIHDGMRTCHKVAIGSVVQIIRYALEQDETLTETWEIAGFDETDLPRRKLAYNAPLAAAIMGLQPGDMAEELQIGARQWDIEVIALHPTRIAGHI